MTITICPPCGDDRGIPPELIDPARSRAIDKIMARRRGEVLPPDPITETEIVPAITPDMVTLLCHCGCGVTFMVIPAGRPAPKYATRDCALSARRVRATAKRLAAGATPRVYKGLP